MGDARWSTSAAFVDYDRDGDLDLFVANYLDFTPAGNKRCTDPAGARDYCAPRAYRPVPDRLYRNEGGGRFTDVTEPSGITKADGAGLGVATGDLQRRRLARSLRRQRRDAEPALDQPAQRHVRGSKVCCRARRSTRAGNPEGSMGIASGDFDATATKTSSSPTSSARRSRSTRTTDTGTSTTRAGASGLGAADRRHHRLRHRLVRLRQRRLARPLHHQRRGQHHRTQRGQPCPYVQTQPVVPQRGQGRFRDDERRVGTGVHAAEIGRGAAFGDIDNDGDIDIVVTNNNGPVRLLLNETNAPAGSRTTSARANGAASSALAGGCAASAAGEPVRTRRSRGPRARRRGHAVAARTHRWQLPERRRQPRALRHGSRRAR